MVDPTIERVWRIYKVTCPAEGKSYIGLTCDTLGRRWANHVWRALNSGYKAKTLLHWAIKRHGADAFTVISLTECVSLPEASVVERALIAEHGTLRPRGYNIATGGMGTPGVRRPHTDETKIKIGLAHRGRKASPEAREKMSIAKKGIVPAAAIAASRAANKGRPQPEWHRQKVAAAHLGKRRPLRSLTFLLKALASLDAGTSKNIRLEHGRWSTRINIGGQRRKHLGTFDTPEAAAEAYRNAILARIEEIQRTHGASSPIVKLALAKGTAMA